MANPNDWKRRLVLSIVYSVVAVFISTVVVVALSSMETPASTQRPGLTGLEAAEYVLGFPLVTGWLFVSLIFGGWRAIHQGQIALVPFVSIAFDALVIFLIWEFVHRKMRRELASDDVLHIN